ncbi:hypothetical protein OXX69_008036 [Metschnikowia pulcherrima]
MLPNSDSLYLYHLTLRAPSSALASVLGNFSGTKKIQELVVSTTTGIDIYRPNGETGKLHKLHTQKAFASVQALSKVRLAGTEKDLLVLSSDSGNLTVAEFNAESSRFTPIIQEPHSKSGFRRTTPGAYLEVDPANRAIMISALESTKLVYKLESHEDSPRLCSALEMTSKHMLTLALCALDTGYENPMWAALEIDQSDYNMKPFTPNSPLLLNYYEFDQGLNHIVRKRSKPDVPASASVLVPMPGHVGGVLVCCNSYLIYEKEPGSRSLVPLPVRKGSAGTQIVCHYLHKLKKSDFFVLLQSALGDLYKVTVTDTEERHPRIKVTYFDSIPVCNSLEILRSGFLFANTTNNNKLFYQFEQLGADNETTTVAQPWTEEDQEDFEKTAKMQHIFSLVGLQNLALVDIIESLGPLTDSALIEPAAGDADSLKQLVTLSSHSYMKSLTYGMPVSELVSSPLPMRPTEIYTTRIHAKSANDQYLVLTSSLNEKTVVLSIGEVVEEVTDSGFVTDQYTLCVQQIGADSLAQIHRNGIRNIRHVLDENLEISKRTTSDWFPPAGITVLHASANNEQIVVALSNREICYFEVDPADSQLVEYEDRFENTGGAVTALAITANPINERKSFFAVVASSDESVQVLSLMPHNCFEILTLQALSAAAKSLLMLQTDINNTHVHIGMENGVYVRVHIDSISGKLSDTRSKYLGTTPVQLRTLKFPGIAQPGILAFTSRPWVGFFNNDGAFKLFPLLGSNITSGTSFFSEDIGTESVVGVSGSNLTIFTLGNDDAGGFNAHDEFTVSSIKLRYTPKKQVRQGDVFYVIQADNNTVSPYTEQKDVDEDYIEAFGYQHEPGKWASCIQAVGQSTGSVLQTIEFGNNECAVAVCLMEAENEKYVVVSTSQDLRFTNPFYSANFLYTYCISPENTLDFVHKTAVDGQVSALESLGGKKLVLGVGSQLRVYEMGKKQFLRKSATKIETLRRPNKIKHIGGDLVLVGDSQNSLTFFQYDSVKNQFVPFVNDVMARQITAFENLDSRTVVGGDKFGNIFVNRVPQSVFDQMSENVLMKYQDGFLNGAAARLFKLCDFYIQDIPTSFQKGTFVVGGTESVVYTGLQGTVGLLLPLATKHEAEFMVKFENLLRKALDGEFAELSKAKRAINLVGREHIKFRSYYNPVKNVVDGDFLERYYELDQASKIKIAGQLDRAPREIERKLYDLRNRAAF